MFRFLFSFKKNVVNPVRETDGVQDEEDGGLELVRFDASIASGGHDQVLQQDPMLHQRWCVWRLAASLVLVVAELEDVRVRSCLTIPLQCSDKPFLPKIRTASPLGWGFSLP